ncbi:MAG TPA: flavodoxin domain-containing protein [Methylocystis sp.]|nr:flavodoxin domain-containing protein [Methylocystis sp.]
MQPILVVYGTTEGHTRKIAEFIAARLRDAGKQVDLVDSASPEAGQTPPIYAGAFIGGSVHYDRHQAALTHFVKENLGWLNVIPTAFFSVNLAMLHSDPEARAEAKQCADAFVAETGLKPQATLLIAGALKYARYDFFKRALLRYLVRPGGMKAEEVSEAEFTDWNELARFVDEFVASTQGEGR